MSAQQPFIGASVLDGLAAAGSRINGGARKPADEAIPVSLIDEDPDQPRRDFDEDGIAALAASMKIVPPGEVEPIGVLEPIGVTAGQGGRYTLVFGARRLRAAIKAEMTKIPARIVPPNQAGLTAQVIENQHRQQFSNSEIAKVVCALVASGMAQDQVCQVVNIPEHSYWHFRAAANMAPAIRGVLDHANMRAAYNLHTAWDKAGETGKRMIEGAVLMLDKNVPEDYLTIEKAKAISELATKISDLQFANANPEVERPVELESRAPRVRRSDGVIKLPKKMREPILDILQGLIEEVVAPSKHGKAWDYLRERVYLPQEKAKP